MKAITSLVIVLAALAASPALAQGATNADQNQWIRNGSRQACLRVGQINGWRALNDRSLIIENDQRQKFKIDLLGICPGLRYRTTIGLRAFGGFSLSCVTPGDTVFFHDVGMSMRCSISKVSVYTPQMEKADREAAEKKKNR